MHIESSVVIDSPPERVFAFISDIQRQPDWIAAVQGVSNLSPGPLHVGSTFRLSLAFMGKTAEADQEITRLDPDRAITQTTTSGPIPTEVTMTLEPSGSGTLLKNSTRADIGSLGRFAGPMISRTIKRQLETDLQTLRGILES
ncbi:MAG TPA: SRPBCC family protein [Thermomicrobiales bacterium]|nr:SRPBCC family protein [Thermomicrobiales bacterium]